MRELQVAIEAAREAGPGDVVVTMDADNTHPPELGNTPVVKDSKSSLQDLKGVGVGVGNLHWFILGTAERETGSKRVGAHRRGVVNKRVATGNAVRKTGRMKPNPIVQRGAQKGRGASLKAMADNFKAGIEREAAKK